MELSPNGLKNRDESSWKQAVDAATQAYLELREKLEREGAGNPAAYGDFVQRRQEIEQRLKKMDELKVHVVNLNNQADACLRHLLEIRRELTASRRTFLEDVLRDNRYVRIQVLPYGARETVEREFRQLLQRGEGGFEKDIGSPVEGGLLGELYKEYDGSDVFEQNLLNIKNRVKKIASGENDKVNVADKRFAAHVGKLPPETMDRLYLWFPEDSLEVEYSPTGDGRDFRSIQQGSPGQRTAALLAFLLSYGDEPLILDNRKTIWTTT